MTCINNESTARDWERERRRTRWRELHLRRGGRGHESGRDATPEDSIARRRVTIQRVKIVTGLERVVLRRLAVSFSDGRSAERQVIGCRGGRRVVKNANEIARRGRGGRDEASGLLLIAIAVGCRA